MILYLDLKPSTICPLHEVSHFDVFGGGRGAVLVVPSAWG